MLLEIEHLRASYGKATALEDITMHVDSGELVAVLGPNGAGRPRCSRPFPVRSRGRASWTSTASPCMACRPMQWWAGASAIVRKVAACLPS